MSSDVLLLPNKFALKAYSFTRNVSKQLKADLRLQHTRRHIWQAVVDFERDIIDSISGCKWEPFSLHCLWWRAPVLLGRWEGTCGKMKAICLDVTMSSVCCVWGKQLHLSRYDEPWTDITRRIHWDLQPPKSKSYQPLTCLFLSLVFSSHRNTSGHQNQRKMCTFTSYFHSSIAGCGTQILWVYTLY